MIRLRTVVIGAGIVGCCTALFLRRAGHDVVLVDREEPGHPGGASFGNAGSIAWSNCVPMAMPGMLRQIPGWLFGSNAPLTVRAAKAIIGEALKEKAARDRQLCDDLVAECYASYDFAEGQRAFAEKRAPRFEGR